MKLLPNISKTIIHSFLFALGGAPTIGMLWANSVLAQDAELHLSVFTSLTILIACVLIPVILIQNIFLIVKKQDVKLDYKVEGLAHFYLVLNLLCLAYWLLKVFKVF